METLSGFLPYIQIILAIALTVLVLIQQSGSELGGAFGGGDMGGIGHTRRGIEKTIFILTIIVAILFVASAITAFII